MGHERLSLEGAESSKGSDVAGYTISTGKKPPAKASSLAGDCIFVLGKIWAECQDAGYR